MSEVLTITTGGLNLFQNPLSNQNGQLIRSVNVDSVPLGAKTKRLGYGTFLGIVDNSSPSTLFSWSKDNGNQTFAYRASGSLLYYYDVTAGTGTQWIQAGNGTLTPNSKVGNSVLNNTLVISQNGGTTRHSTTGTSFSDTSGAPAGEAVAQYQNRIYITGTSSNLTYSVTGDPTNWSTTGTSDSSSLVIPGPGNPNKLFVLTNRLNISKNSGHIFRWDGFSLQDTATNLGPTSPYSMGKVDDAAIWLSRLGLYFAAGAQPQLISNALQPQIYNDSNTGIAGTTFGSAPAIIHKYDYLLAVGSVKDDFTNEPLNNAIIKYNYQKNEFLNYQFNNFPTAFGTYLDNTGKRQLIFGDSSGQCYTFGTGNTDNGQTIPAVIEQLFHFGSPHIEKDFRWFWGFFNPGCEAQIQIAVASTFIKGGLNWINLGDAVSGVVQYRFPTGTRGRILYVKIIESSRNTPFSYYGCATDYKEVDVG